MATTRMAGPGIGLTNIGITGNNSKRTLQAGQIHIIPAGQYYVTTGAYCQLQTLDPITGIWQGINAFSGAATTYVNSDGVNYRIVNLSGCVVGAWITNNGANYTSTPTVTLSAGNGTATAVVGGAITANLTSPANVTSAGAGYNYAPMLVWDAPPPGGVPATGYIALNGNGTLGNITMVNQGAGYTTPPNCTIINDPREATAATPGPTTAAKVSSYITGNNTVTAILVTNPGSPQTAVPTFNITGGGGSSAAATAVMAFAVTGVTVGSGGAGYGTNQTVNVITGNGTVGGAAATVTNPQLGPNLFTPRQANIALQANATGVVVATGNLVVDGGLFQAVPAVYALAAVAGNVTTANLTATVGGQVDNYTLQPF